MTASNFPTCLRLVLVHEGGYVDHPKDPGGATNKGITIATFRGWAGNNSLTKEDLRNITDETVAKIYHDRYWMKVRGDDLPLGLDYTVFDFGVNSGPSRSIKFLQRAVGVEADGVFGEKTLAAVKAFGAVPAIISLSTARLAWLKTLGTFETFGKGWSRRVAEVEQAALKMTQPAAAPTPRVETRPPAPSASPKEHWITKLFRAIARLFRRK